MSSSDKTSSLLASLTSLSAKEENGWLADPEDDAQEDEEPLPSLAVEDIAEDPPCAVPSQVSGTHSSHLENVNKQNPNGSNKRQGSVLLTSSGLLHLDSDGGGLFDDIDQEEEEAKEAARLEEEQKRRRAQMEEQLRREKEAADRSKIQLQKEAQAKAQQELKQQQEEAERQRQQRLQQQQQEASYMNYGSVMGSMQELNLNDDAAINNPARAETMSYGGNSQYSNIQNGPPNQYSNIQNNSSMHNSHVQYSNVHGTGSQYSTSQPGNGNQYSNVQNVQGAQYEQHQLASSQFQQYPQVQAPMSHLQSNQPNMSQHHTAMATQDAVSGYGGSSYMYSTSGNIQPSYQTLNGRASNLHHAGMPQGPTLSSSQFGGPSVLASSQSPMMQPTNRHPMINHQSVNCNINNNLNHGAGYNDDPFVSQYDPSKFSPCFGQISVTDPILVQSPGVFAGPPHWTYAVVVRDVKKIEGQNQFSAVVSNVRRRFRHFVALEERLRAECRGAILPPRPNKHTTRAIDEASTRQSAQFAMQRAKELEAYLNALRLHPLAGNSQSLHMFLTLPDHLGIAWPEVSSSILTRLTEAGTSTAVKVAEGTSAVIAELNSENQIMAGEDNAEILALASSEGLRISAVLQSVPKIENAIALMSEQSQRMNAVGMELQKLVNTVLVHDKQYSAPFETLSSGLLRSGRRTNRLAIELGAANQSFTLQHKLCRYERLAFSDRRSALIRRRDARKEADKKAQKLFMNQYSLQSMGNYGKLEGYGRDVAMSDEIAADSVKEADHIGHVLQCEVNRICQLRHREWSMSIRVMAANLREAHAERAAIWESCRNALAACNTD